MIKKLLPVVPKSGFRMEGYYIWCGSAMVNKEGEICLFAARWPKKRTFPLGYMTDSEIVLAKSSAPDKPFKYVKTIIDKRDGDKWDSMMAHNPFITKIGDKFVLYYIGNPDGRAETRRIGYAYADNLEGPWHRSEKAISLPDDSNNPAPFVTPEGKINLYFRDGDLKVYIAQADTFDGEYKIVRENVFPKGGIEDMFVYMENDKYYMLAEDCVAAYTGVDKGGVLFESDNGLDWTLSKNNPAYGFNVEYTDGTKKELQRRERPFLLKYKGKTYLLNGAKFGGETKLTGGDTWNMIEEVEEF